MNNDTIKELRKRADELISTGVANKDASLKVAAFLAGLVVGLVAGDACGCSVFGPGVGASVYRPDRAPPDPFDFIRAED